MNCSGHSCEMNDRVFSGKVRRKRGDERREASNSPWLVRVRVAIKSADHLGVGPADGEGANEKSIGCTSSKGQTHKYQCDGKCPLATKLAGQA